jgi:hypothetical protein
MPNFKKITAPTLDNNSRSASGGKQTNQISIFQKLENLQQILVMFLLISFVNSLLNLSCFLIGGSGVVLFFNQSFFPYLSPPRQPNPLGTKDTLSLGTVSKDTFVSLGTLLSVGSRDTFVPKDIFVPKDTFHFCT